MTVTAPLGYMQGASKMMPLVGTIVEPFPDPPMLVTAAMDELQTAAMEPPEDPDDIRRLAELPRPWDPGTCEPVLRGAVWEWLDEVAAWINEQHLWNTTRPGIPPCWPAHPHLAHDLAVVASARCFASYAATPAALDEWHRYTLPMFLDRIRDRAGDCCQGGHPERKPRQARDEEFHARNLRAGRRERFRDDARRVD